MKICDGWTLESTRRAVGRFGEPYDIVCSGRPTGEKGWPLVIEVVATAAGLAVAVDDDQASYTSGSSTSVTVPWEVIDAIRGGAR